MPNQLLFFLASSQTVPSELRLSDAAFWIALRDTPGLRRIQATRLLEAFGTPQAIFGRPARDLACGCAYGTARLLERGPDLTRACAEVARAAAGGISVVPRNDPAFPPLLGQIPDPPLVLYQRGRLGEWSPALTIVGSRRATARGRETAHFLAAEVAAAGVRVVSGLAYGVDAAAHEGALAGAGLTVAVLASGLDRPGPSGNRRLAQRILEAGGAWLSEYPPGAVAYASRFPERNRLISGLAPQSLIVEARERSGSLWTARHALDQGREVLAVPGPIDTTACRGSNRLIQQGAGVVLDAEDLLRQVVPHQALALFGPAPEETSGPVDRLLDFLEAGPQDLDPLARELGMAASELSQRLVELELEGRIRRAGSRVALVRRVRKAPGPI